jgi:hypothetical protein
MLTSLISGGLLGVIGSIFSNTTGDFEKKQELKQQIELKKLDLEKMDRVHEYQLKGKNIDADVKMEESADDVQEQSYSHDNMSYSKGQKFSWLGRILLVLLDITRALVRPALTLFLIWQVHETRMEVKTILDAAGIAGLSLEESLSIYREIVQMILFLASTATCWWFGTRPVRGDYNGSFKKS